MLYSPGDSTSKIDVGLHGSACLAYLIGMVNPPGIHSCSRSTHYTAQLIGKLLHQIKSTGLSQSSPTGTYNIGIRQANHFFGGLHNFYNLRTNIAFMNARRNFYQLTTRFRIFFSFLHNPRSDCRHLRPGSWADNGGH